MANAVKLKVKEKGGETHATILQNAKDNLDAGVAWDSLTPDEKKAVEIEYGSLTNLISGNNDLLKLFTDAVTKGYTPQKFDLAIKQTNWYRSRTASQQWYALQQADPSSAKELEAVGNSINQEVQDYIVQTLGKNPNDPATAEAIKTIGQTVLENYYKDPYSDWHSHLPNLVAAQFKNVKFSDLTGTISTQVSDIQKYAASMGIPLDVNALNGYTNGFLHGTMTYDSATNALKKNAAGMWSQFADRINAGESVKGILTPYTQLIGSMLEMDPGQLDMTNDSNGIDPLLQKALFSGSDNKTVMSLYDLRKSIKADPRWQKTRNAAEEYSGLTRDLMRMFGAGV